MGSIESGREAPSAKSVATLLASSARKLGIAFADMCERRAWRGQFESWKQHGETESVLEAFGLERGQIPLFIDSMPKAARLLPAMITRVGAAVRPQAELLRICALCPSQGRCRQWLNSGATTGFEAFCPNAAVLGTASAATLCERLR